MDMSARAHVKELAPGKVLLDQCGSARNPVYPVETIWVSSALVDAH